MPLHQVLFNDASAMLPYTYNQWKREMISDFNLIPVPTHEDLLLAEARFTMERAAFVHIHMLDESGTPVLPSMYGRREAGKHVVVMNVSDLKPGRYCCGVTAGEETLIRCLRIKDEVTGKYGG